MTKSGKQRVKQGIESATPATPSADALPGANVPSYMLAQYEMRPNGLHCKTGKEGRSVWICSAFEIEAETIDAENDGWGFLLSWHDRDGLVRREVFSRRLFSGDCGELRSRLADGGLTMSGAAHARQSFAEYLSVARSDLRAHCVSRIGWHRFGVVRVFVLDAETVFGTAPHRVILQTPGREASPFGQGGTLDGWRKGVGELAIGNPHLVFAIACAFAAALLDPTGEDGGGFHLRGSSRSGKTTALRVAASVWGGAPGVGAAAYVRIWRATANGLESVAVAHNDALLLLDEMAQIDAKEVGDIAYLLANGQGKARSDRAGGLRVPARWRTLFLSSGEIGLNDKNAEAGRMTKAGQEMRLIDLSADAGLGLGLFSDLHDAASADEFAEALRQAVRQNYGTAARAFLAWLTASLVRDVEFLTNLRQRIEAAAAELLRPYPRASGQVVTVARRFGLVRVAGELATETHVTGWAKDEAAGAIAQLFGAWIAERGTTGNREDAQAVAQLGAFISLHGSARFELWKDRDPPAGAQADPEAQPPSEAFRVIQRAGWRRWIAFPGGGYGWRYYLTPSGMDEALSGLDKAAAHKALIASGALLPGPGGKSSTPLKPPGIGQKIRLYVVNASVMGAGMHEADDVTRDGSFSTKEN